MHRDNTPHGWLRHGNPPGDPASAPRCGAQTRRKTACQAPAMANGRCRMHGGKSTGPTTLAGLARIRAARTITGRYSAEGLTLAAWQRRYIRNGFRSIKALGAGTIRDQEGRRRDGPTYLRALVAREAAEGIAPAVVEAERQAVRAAIRDRDVRRLRAKGCQRAGVHGRRD